MSPSPDDIRFSTIQQERYDHHWVRITFVDLVVFGVPTECWLEIEFVPTGAPGSDYELRYRTQSQGIASSHAVPCDQLRQVYRRWEMIVAVATHATLDMLQFVTHPGSEWMRHAAAVHPATVVRKRLEELRNPR